MKLQLIRRQVIRRKGRIKYLMQRDFGNNSTGTNRKEG